MYRDFGQVNNPFASRKGCPRKLDQGDLTYITSVLDANPSVDELQEKLLMSCDVEMSIVTLSRTLRRMAVTNKKVSKMAMERNEVLRATWQAAYGDIPKEYFVWLDESGVDNRTNQRGDGWSLLGTACVRRMTFVRGQRFSVLPALSVDGMIALDIFEGAVDKEKFLTFLREQGGTKEIATCRRLEH